MAKSRPLKRGPFTGGAYTKLQPVKTEHIEVDDGFGLEDAQGVVVARSSSAPSAPVALGGVAAWPPLQMTDSPTPAATDRVALQQAGGAGRSALLSGLPAALGVPKRDGTLGFLATPPIDRAGYERHWLVRSDRRMLEGAGLRGEVDMLDSRIRGRRTLARRSGRWCSGFQPGVRPDDVDSFWRTEVVAGFSGTTGAGLVIGDLFTGTVTGFTGKVLDVQGSQVLLSMFGGTFAPEIIQKTGAPGDTITGVSLISGAKLNAGYTDISGRKVPFLGAGGPSFNTIAAQQSLGFSGQPTAWPLRPEDMRRTFWMPPGLFLDGAMWRTRIAGYLTQTFPITGVPTNDAMISVALAIDQNIFTLANLQSTGGFNATQIEFRFQSLPLSIGTRMPFIIELDAWAMRHEDRSKTQQFSCSLRGLSAWSPMLTLNGLRGSDHPTAPTTLPAWDFQSAGRDVAVRFLASPWVPASGAVEVTLRSLYSEIEV